jgi:hypothetical protein
MLKSILLSLSLLSFEQMNAQHVFVSSHDPYEIAGTKHEGEMILKKGTILKGIFQYNTFVLPDDGFEFFSNSGIHIKKIKEELIEKLTLAGADTLLSNRDSTFFISIKSRLFRQLTFDIVQLYDPTIYVNERSGLINSEGYFHENVFAIENGKIIRFNAKKDILKFVHNKLAEKGIDQSFKTLRQAIHYLNYNNL